MAGEETSPPSSVVRGAFHAYPGDLTRFVRSRWEGTPPDPDGSAGTTAVAPGLDDPALSEVVLGAFFSGCYQASLLREEERSLYFRAILAEPALFEEEGGAPDGFQKLEFPGTRAFDIDELRRLSVAADFHRALIGVRLNADGELRIWGLLHSGARWLRDARGGRRAGAALPYLPVVHVLAPGSIEVYKGNEPVGKLERGELSDSRSDLFESRWLPAEFAGLREEFSTLHADARERARLLSGERWSPLEPDLDRQIAHRMLKRIVSVVRDARHGGTLIFVPPQRAGEIREENPYISLKYPFVEGRPRVRFRELIAGIMNRLARLHGADDPAPVRWEEFETTADAEIATLDEALFEMAYLISGLAATDGAVVMDKHQELLGFGAEISGGLPEVRVVSRALDLEGDKVRKETVEEEGTRHRSAYRLAAAMPGVLAVVVSQDGGVQFVSSRDGRVIYWEQ